MPLNKEDFSEEVWAEIQADIDRERLKASDTARKNALKSAEAEMNEKIQTALNDERARMEMNEQEKLDVERKKIDEARRALDADKKSLAATKKLVSAGFPDDAIESVLPLFIGLDDKTFPTAVDSFINVNQNLIKAQVDSVKQELLNNATPPSTNTDAPVDKAAAAMAAAKQGNDAAAIDLLLGSIT